MAKKKSTVTKIAEITPQKKAALTRIGQNLVETANAIRVGDEVDFEHAGRFLTGCKAAQKTIKEEMDPIAQNAHATWKGITGLRAKLLSPIEEAELIVKRKIGTYLDRVEREREAEARRLEAEAVKAIEAAREAAGGDGAEGEIEDEDVGFGVSVAALAIRSAPPPKAEGISSRTLFKVVVSDMTAFLKWASEDPSRYAFVTPNMGMLNDMARRTSGNVEIPGVKVVKERSIAASAG